MENHDIQLNIKDGTISIMSENGIVKTYTKDNAEEYLKETQRIYDLKIMNWPSDFPSKHDNPEDYEQE
jgi:hypothetical protein